MITISMLLITMIILLFLSWKKKSQQNPKAPGPKGLPIFGNTFQLNSESSHLQLTEWAEEYGGLYELNVLCHKVVVLSSYELIHRALFTESETFSGRPLLTRARIVHRGGFYVTLGDFSKRWRALKKLVLRGLRLYRVNQLELETLEITQNLLDQLEARQGQPTQVKNNIQGIMVNLDFMAMCGRPMSPSDVTLFIQTEAETLPLLSPTGRGCELDLVPWLRFLPHAVVAALRNIDIKNASIFEPAISEKMANFDHNEPNMDCILDHLLRYNQAVTKESENPYTNQDIRAILEDLCTAGISTSSAVTYGLLTLCATSPNLQGRLQEHIDDVIGWRRPSLSDRCCLPLVEAVVLEWLRLMTPVPVSVPHKTTCDVIMDGYIIKSGTHVLINLWSLHHNEKYWDDPWDFRPERFLTPTGTLVPPTHITRQRLLPFGGGRRMCAGETVAKGRLFLILTSILQRFTILPEVDGGEALPLPDPRGFTGGIVLYPPPMKMRFIPRKQSNLT